MKILPDSSSIIALAKIGALELLERVFGRVVITREVEGEITAGNFPEVGEIKKAIGRWIEVEEVESGEYMEFESLGDGEKSILSYAKNSSEDVLLILDEAEARAVAKAEGFNFTGTIGLIVFACETGRISKEEAVDIVKRLARSDFRMTLGCRAGHWRGSLKPSDWEMDKAFAVLQ
jgi:hypothetical protein